ncbi:hypothetical protein K8I31_20890, partial [bacterium]|nr:hypothetical protein [bacterium]
LNLCCFLQNTSIIKIIGIDTKNHNPMLEKTQRIGCRIHTIEFLKLLIERTRKTYRQRNQREG